MRGGPTSCGQNVSLPRMGRRRLGRQPASPLLLVPFPGRRLNGSERPHRAPRRAPRRAAACAERARPSASGAGRTRPSPSRTAGALGRSTRAPSGRARPCGGSRPCLARGGDEVGLEELAEAGLPDGHHVAARGLSAGVVALLVDEHEAKDEVDPRGDRAADRAAGLECRLDDHLRKPVLEREQVRMLLRPVLHVQPVGRLGDAAGEHAGEQTGQVVETDELDEGGEPDSRICSSITSSLR